jgi:hypothetical protein
VEKAAEIAVKNAKFSEKYGPKSKLHTSLGVEMEVAANK